MTRPTPTPEHVMLGIFRYLHRCPCAHKMQGVWAAAVRWASDIEKHVSAVAVTCDLDSNGWGGHPHTGTAEFCLHKNLYCC